MDKNFSMRFGYHSVSKAKHLLIQVDMADIVFNIRALAGYDWTHAWSHDTVMDLANFVFSIKTGISPAFWSLLACAILTHSHRRTILL